MKITLQDCCGQSIYTSISPKTALNALFSSWKSFTGEMVPFMQVDKVRISSEDSTTIFAETFLKEGSIIHVPTRIPKPGVGGMPLGVPSGFSLNPWLEYGKL